MNWETIITELKAHFEVIEILLPTGQVVQCIKQEAVLIPIAKVTVYGMGKSLVTSEELAELEQLKRERRTNQRAFRESGKLDRLHELQRRRDNQRKSLENLAAPLETGLFVTGEDIRQIMAHLLECGAAVTTSTSGGEMVRTQLPAPRGLLTIQTGWKVLDMVMDNQVNDLLLLTDQDIDFKSLSAEILEQLALESDSYIANAALTELWARDSGMAAEAAQELLARTTGEHFLQATALRVLFAANRESALHCLLTSEANVHPQLLNTLIDLLMYESDFHYELQMARIVKQQIAGHEEEMGDYLDPDAVADFVQVMQ